MPNLSSPLGTTQNYIPLINSSQLGKCANLIFSVADVSTLDAIKATELANIAAESAVWPVGQLVKVLTDPDGTFRKWDGTTFVTISFSGSGITLGTANGLSLSGQALSLALASGSTTGALSSANWTTFNNKQAALVSGTNIKTINGSSILGSGDLTTPTATAADIAGIIHAGTGKATPVDSDELALSDSAATFGFKKVTFSSLKATLKTYFDTLYAAAGSYLTTAGFTMAGTINMDKNILNNAYVGLYSQRRGSVSQSGGTLTFDFTNGSIFSFTLTGNVTSIVFSNLPTSVDETGFKVTLNNPSTYTVTGWPTGTKWPGGTTPTITTNGIDVIAGPLEIVDSVYRLARAHTDSK